MQWPAGAWKYALTPQSRIFELKYALKSENKFDGDKTESIGKGER